MPFSKSQNLKCIIMNPNTGIIQVAKTPKCPGADPGSYDNVRKRRHYQMYPGKNPANIDLLWNLIKMKSEFTLAWLVHSKIDKNLVSTHIQNCIHVHISWLSNLCKITRYLWANMHVHANLTVLMMAANF